MAYNKDTEIRKVKPEEMYKLAIILNDSDAWKKLMTIVLKEGDIPRFDGDHIRTIEQASQYRDKRNPAQIFLDEWSTMGRKRPTLGILLELLIQAELFRAADYVACDLLKQQKLKRPSSGPAASIDTSDAAIDDLLEKQMLLQNPLLLGSTSEIEIYFRKDKDNSMNNENANNLSDTDENSSSCHKSADVISAIESNLIKFSTTNISEAGNKDIECNFASVSKRDSEEILKTSNPENSIDETHTYEVSEVSTQELPVVILPVIASNNNPEQSATELNEEMCSSDMNIPLCIKK
ncbi:protein Tube [Linepithema humile]|uniref:protein Tube n=1 Tax=Linepithema humile TaxID=83485 RepID=UPI000623880A|nr:PREDICTED: protein Tube [Linepithema humile]